MIILQEDKEYWFNIGSHPPLDSDLSRNISKDSSPWQKEAFFHNLARISGKNLLNFHENFIVDVSINQSINLFVQMQKNTGPDTKGGCNLR